MRTVELDYRLPEAAIAQAPVEPRDAARLLVDRGPGTAPVHRHVRDLPDLVGRGDVVVVNTSRVLPARLHLRKATGGAVEVLLLEPAGDGDQDWVGLVRPGRRVPSGTTLAAGPDLALTVGDDLGEGRRQIHLDAPGGLLAALDRHGTVPLPPYITRPLDDPERYQTVFGDRPGSVAAPTAGLHLTSDLLAAVRGSGAEVVSVELVVGLGTFRPIDVSEVERHAMHAERYQVPASTLAACQAAARVVAIGTTSVRALESAARTGALEGRTELFLWGDADFVLVDALLTNFHLPRSSLLALVDAFVGRRWRQLYATALAEGYRFLSFGDAMFLCHERGDR